MPFYILFLAPRGCLKFRRSNDDDCSSLYLSTIVILIRLLIISKHFLLSLSLYYSSRTTHATTGLTAAFFLFNPLHPHLSFTLFLVSANLIKIIFNDDEKEKSDNGFSNLALLLSSYNCISLFYFICENTHTQKKGELELCI